MPKPRDTFSTSELSRRSGDIIAEALRRPVTITQRSKPRLVLLNIDDFERLRRQADTRRSGTLATLPDGLLAEIEDAVDVYAQSDDFDRS
jgi:prevent-host-death family protein